MARIYLDARNITAQPAGVARYAGCLIPELVRAAPRHDFVVIRHSSNREPILVDGAPMQEVFVERGIDDLANFALGTRTLRAVFDECGPPDLYHDLFHILPLGTRRAAARPFKVVVTLHDLVWIDYADESQSTWLKARTIKLFASAAIPYALRSADHVISISEPTTRRAKPWLKAGQVSTISHGVDLRYSEPVEPPTQTLPAPYIVAIGNAKQYKNLALLIEAFARLRTQTGHGHLVLIGNCADLKDTIAGAGLTDHVTLTGFLDDLTLRQVLGHARAFVFPSLVEGFGLPILEAMAMGVPTLVSDLEPMRTVAGGAGLLFDPHDPIPLAEQLGQVMRDDALFKELREGGRSHAAQFRWPLTAQKTLEVYETLLGQVS